MPQLILCLDEEVYHFAKRFDALFSKPQYQYLVTVLLGLMECDGKRTLSGLLREVGQVLSLSGLLVEALSCRNATTGGSQTGAGEEGSTQAPWPPQRTPSDWVSDRGRRGRSSKPKGRKMQGLGKHHSTTHDQRIIGHSLVQGLYLLLDRRCPLAPHLYRQGKVCQAEDVAFSSKIELMETLIREFEPVAGTRTHILLDSWYSAKRLWHAARERGFLITTGLKSNRWVRVPDDTVAQGWRWQKLSAYAAGLSERDFELLPWPRGGKKVYVHVVKTSVRKLYRCHVVIVRHNLTAPLSQTRYWGSSDLEANAKELLAHVAARWDIEVFFGDGKEELGLDHYQVMSASVLLRFWTLAMLAYVFLEEEQQRLRLSWQRPVTIGEARREIQRRHRRCLLEWLHDQFLSGVHPETLFELFAA